MFDITLPYAYSYGGYLVITFPPECKVQSRWSCSFSTGFDGTP